MSRLLNHGGPVSVAGRKLDGRRGYKPAPGELPDSLLDHPVIKGLLASGRLELLDAAEPAPEPESKPKAKKKRSKRKSKAKPEPAPAPEPEPEPEPDLEPMDPAEE